MEQEPGSRAAGKAGEDTHHEHRISQSGAVDDQLRVQQDGTHHKGGQPVVLHPSFGKGGGYGDSSIHAERRGYAKGACCYDPKEAQSCFLQGRKGPVDLLLGKYGYSGADHHAQYPVTEDLLKLNRKIVPYVYKFALQDLCDHVLSSFRAYSISIYSSAYPAYCRSIIWFL